MIALSPANHNDYPRTEDHQEESGEQSNVGEKTMMGDTSHSLTEKSRAVTSSNDEEDVRVTSRLFTSSNLAQVEHNTKHAHYINVKHTNIIRKVVPSVLLL